MLFYYIEMLTRSCLPDMLLPLMRPFNEVLHEVLSQGVSEIQVVKLLAIQVYLSRPFLQLLTLTCCNSDAP